MADNIVPLPREGTRRARNLAGARQVSAAGMERRSFIAAGLVATIAAGVVAPALADSATTVTDRIGRDWDAAMKRYLKCKAEADTFYATVHDPLWREISAAEPDYVIQHRARSGTTGTYHVWPGRFKEFAKPAGGWDTYAFIRPQIDAIMAAHEEYMALRKKVRWDEVSERTERYTDAVLAAEDALIALPAPDVKALSWKVNHLFAPKSGDDGTVDPYAHSYIQPIFDDLARLGGVHDGA